MDAYANGTTPSYTLSVSVQFFLPNSGFTTAYYRRTSSPDYQNLQSPGSGEETSISFRPQTELLYYYPVVSHPPR